MENTPATTSLNVSGSASAVPTVSIESDEASAPPEPKLPKKGVYVLQQGDTPGVVSQKLFGRSNRAVELFRANMDVIWDVGSEITIP